MAARRIKWAKVTKLALCKRGMNGLDVMFKSQNPDSNSMNFQFESMAKMSEKGELTTVVYAPDNPDHENHYASADLIKKIAHEALRDGGLELNLEHEGEDLKKSDAHVVESFIIAKGDERFKDWRDYENKPVDVTGGWGVIVQVDNEALRKAFRNGDWKGISMEGKMLLEARKSEASAPEPKEDTMTPEQIAALTGTITSTLEKSIEKAVAPLKAELDEMKKSKEKELTEAEKVQQEKDEKRRRLRKALRNADAGSDEELLCEKRLAVLENEEDMEKADKADDIDEIRELKKTRQELRNDIKELEKSVEKARAEKDKQDRINRATAGAGGSSRLAKSKGSGDSDNPMDALTEVLARRMGKSQNGVPQNVTDEEAFDVGMGSLLASMANEEMGTTALAKSRRN